VLVSDDDSEEKKINSTNWYSKELFIFLFLS
jgi:hypothetical protein